MVQRRQTLLRTQYIASLLRVRKIHHNENVPIHMCLLSVDCAEIRGTGQTERVPFWGALPLSGSRKNLPNQRLECACAHLLPRCPKYLRSRALFPLFYDYGNTVNISKCVRCGRQWEDLIGLAISCTLYALLSSCMCLLVGYVSSDIGNHPLSHLMQSGETRV